MKVFDWLLGEKRSDGGKWNWPKLFSGESNSGVKIDEWKSLQLSVCYACIRLISNSIAMLPLTLHQSSGDSSRIASENHLNKVLYRKSNKYMSAFLFKQTMQSHLLMFGNAYAEIIRNNKGEVIELWPLSPWNMTVKFENGIKIYEYLMEGDSKPKILNNDIVFHIPGLSFDGLKGYSPIQVMKNEIGLGVALQTFGANYFKNGTNMGGHFEHPGKLGENARMHLKKDIDKNYSGLENAMKNIILEEGMKYIKHGIPAEEAQFIQSRKFQLEEICRYYGVQLHMIQNLDKSSFNNIEHQGIEFKTYCLGPWAAIWESEIWCKLLTEIEQENNYYSKFNFNALMRADYKTRMEGYRTAVQMGLYSLNEIRKLEDENPIPSEAGDVHWVNSAMIPIDKQLTTSEPEPEPESEPEPEPESNEEQEGGENNQE